MLNACHPETTDRSTGCIGLSGTRSDDQSRWGSPGFMARSWYACEIDPVLDFPWRRFKFGIIRPVHFVLQIRV
jgi:hypothetical protein